MKYSLIQLGKINPLENQHFVIAELEVDYIDNAVNSFSREFNLPLNKNGFYQESENTTYIVAKSS